MNVYVTIRPGVMPMDRGYVEDRLLEAIERDLGASGESTGGGTLMGDGGPAESDFDLELDTDDTDGVKQVCSATLGAIPFTLRTTMTVTIDDEPPLVIEAGGDDGPPVAEA